MIIEKIVAMPQLVKTDDGYGYDDKFVGKLFKINDKLVYFQEKSYQMYPIELLQHIKDFISSESYTNLVIDTKFESITNEISSIKDGLDEIKNKINELDSGKNVMSIIDAKLVNVYTKFETIGKKLVTEYFNDKLDEIKKGNTPKMKLSVLTRLKEDGWSMEEIKNASDFGLI